VSEQKDCEKSTDDVNNSGSGCGLCFLTTLALIIAAGVFTILGYLDLKEMAILSGALIVIMPLIWFFGLSTVWWVVRKITGTED
jgi:hypothetical protein